MRREFGFECHRLLGLCLPTIHEAHSERRRCSLLAREIFASHVVRIKISDTESAPFNVRALFANPSAALRLIFVWFFLEYSHNLRGFRLFSRSVALASVLIPLVLSESSDAKKARGGHHSSVRAV